MCVKQAALILWGLLGLCPAPADSLGFPGLGQWQTPVLWLLDARNVRTVAPTPAECCRLAWSSGKRCWCYWWSCAMVKP